MNTNGDQQDIMKQYQDLLEWKNRAVVELDRLEKENKLKDEKIKQLERKVRQFKNLYILG